MAGGPVDVTARKFLEIIRRSAEQMGLLIGDLFDVTRMESGGLVVEPEEGDVAELVEEAQAALEPLAGQRSIHLAVEIANGLPRARFDRARIHQALSNLIGNALKFTPPGGRVTVGVDQEDEWIRLYVADTGEGIPADQLPRIFQPFWQAQIADRRGLGIGLTIARGIVEGHGGRIWVESEPGEGSTFYFTLPASSSVSLDRVGAGTAPSAGWQALRTEGKDFTAPPHPRGPSSGRAPSDTA
jgi:signal transduction histidine kinase